MFDAWPIIIGKSKVPEEADIVPTLMTGWILYNEKMLKEFMDGVRDFFKWYQLEIIVCLCFILIF